MIRPALLIDLSPQELQRIDSQMTYLERLRNAEFEQETLRSHLELMKADLSDMYERVKEDQTDPSLLWVMFSIGGMIILSLTYVGWKKNTGQKKEKYVKKNNVANM